MYLSNNLKKSYYVFRSVKNSLRVINTLRKWSNDEYMVVDIELKNGIRFKKVPVGAAWAIINYYYWSNKFNSYSKVDMDVFYNICKDIYSKLKGACMEWPAKLWGLQGTHGILFMIVRKYKPEILIETGISRGYSSYFILSAIKLNGNGKLISIDVADEIELCKNKYIVGWLVPDDLRKNWEVVRGLTSDVLPKLTGNVDIFMHDSLHTQDNMTYEYDWAYGKLKEGGILISDDIDLNYAWKNFIKSHKNMEEIIKSVTTGVSIKV